MRKRIRYKDTQSPQEFLTHVLNTWTEFCYVNCGVAQAISDLLNLCEAQQRIITNLCKKEVATPRGNDHITTKR